MDRTIDKTVDSIRAQLASVEGHVTALAGAQFEPLVEVGGYGEAVRLNCVVVHHVNCDAGSHRDIHHRPEAAMELAAVESDVHSLVSHYYDEISRVWRVGRMTGTANRTKSEPVKCVRRSEKPSEHYHNKNPRQN